MANLRRESAGDAVGGGAVRADSHDVSDGGPQLVDHRAAEFGFERKSEQDLAPLVAEFLVEGIAAGGVEGGAHRFRGQASRATGGGEGEATPCGVEVVALRQDEGEVVTEGRGVGAVEDHSGLVGLAGGKELGALLRGQVGGGVERVINHGREKSAKLLVHLAFR